MITNGGWHRRWCCWLPGECLLLSGCWLLLDECWLLRECWTSLVAAIVWLLILGKFSNFTKWRFRKVLVKYYFGRVTLERREVLIIGNLPEGREMDDADCSADRVLSNGMSSLHVTNRSVAHVWNLNIRTNCVEPRLRLNIFAFFLHPRNSNFFNSLLDW